jgi:hypothetical protein
MTPPPAEDATRFWLPGVAEIGKCIGETLGPVLAELAGAARAPKVADRSRTIETLPEAAARTGVGVKRLRAAVAAGEIATVGGYKQARALVDDVNNWLRENRQWQSGSTARKARRTGTTTSSSKVFAFSDLLRLKAERSPGASLRASAPKPSPASSRSDRRK